MGRSAIYQCLNCRLAQRVQVDGDPVATLLALKRCPRCGYYDHGVASHNRRTLRFAQVTLLIAFVFAALAVLLVAPRLAFGVSVGVLAVVYAVVVRRLATRYPYDVETRVSLVETWR